MASRRKMSDACRPSTRISFGSVAASKSYGVWLVALRPSATMNWPKKRFVGSRESASAWMSFTISCSSGAPLSSGTAATSTPLRSVRVKVTARSGRIITAVVRTSHGIIVIPCHGSTGFATIESPGPMIAMPEDCRAVIKAGRESRVPPNT